MGLLLAISVLQIKRGQRFFRVIFLLPMMIGQRGWATSSGECSSARPRDQSTIFSSNWGCPSCRGLSNPGMAPWTIVIADVWQWTSFMFVLLLAGLQSLPEEPFEAARVDGANTLQIFTQITFPLLVPVTVTAILIRSP